MTEHPIIFTAESIRAIVDGRKVQSRRIIDFKKLRARMLCRVNSGAFCGTPLTAKNGNLYPVTFNPNGAVSACIKGDHLGLKPGEFDFRCPYASGETHIEDFGKRNKQWVIQPVGENRLWVKEGWAVRGAVARSDDPIRPGMKIVYRSDHDHLYGESWRSPIYMPRWASRINLVVESVRVERLQDISDEDAWAEGVVGTREVTMYEGKARGLFESLWDEINGKRSPWKDNVWVWVLRFRKLDATPEKKG